MAGKVGGQSIGARIRALMVGILIGLLVIGFAIWGISDVFSPQSARAVASVGDTEIMADDFERAFKREIEALAQESGTSLSHEEAYQQGVHSRVLGSLIQQSVLAADADDLGIGVNRKQAREQVSKISVFEDELTGKFSEDKYLSILSQNRITREQYENDVYRDLRRAQTVPGIIGGVEAPTEYAMQRYKFLTEQRKASVLTLTRDAIAAPADPDDETLKAFIEKNAAAFTAPEYRRVSLIRIEDFDLIPDVTVDDESLKEAFQYKVELGELGSPETRSIVQLYAADEETAKKAGELLKTDQEPEVIASGLGLIEPEHYTNVFADDIVDSKAADAAFEGKKDDVKIIFGSLGQWYALKITDITPAVKPDFGSMKEKLRAELLKEHAQEKLYDITTEIEDFMTDNLTLAEIASKTNTSLQSFDFISRLGETQDGVKLSGIGHLIGVGDDDTILREIFTNDMGYETDLFETSSGGWAAVSVEDIIESTMRPFDEVKTQATAMWKTEQIDEALQELMLEVASKAQQGEELADIAKDIDGTTLEDVILMRSARNETLGPVVTVGLLGGDLGDIERGEGNKPLTRQIAKLTDIIANSDSLAGTIADQLQEQATLAIRSDIQQAYQDAILKENTLTENQAKIKSVLGIDNDL